MPPVYVYHPFIFYIITIGISLVSIPILIYLIPQKGMPVLLVNLFVPFITAMILIYASNNDLLINDFWKRVCLFRINLHYLLIIILLMPSIVITATTLSLPLGYSTNQFSFATEISVIKGWGILGVLLPLLLAPIIEELGWRGYGVDSVRVYLNLFTTSAIFGFLWAVWHLPLFFIKDYYHQHLLSLGTIYVVNFFLSVFITAFLMNWIYYKTDRSIPAAVLFHFMLNLSLVLFKTDPFTKCIVTMLLFVVAIIVIIFDDQFFFQ